MQTAMRALEDKHLSADDWDKDNRTLQKILFKIRMKQLPKLPFVVARKIGRMING